MNTHKVLTFGASNSKNSINKQLATFTAQLIPDSEATVIDLNDFEMPIYGIDRERASGIPQKAKEFKQLIKEHDGIIISFAEHNGAYSTAFKNIFDWVSRLEGKVWKEKPMFLLATSNGKRGGATVLEIAIKRMPFNGGKVVATFSLPEFKINFSAEEGVVNDELLAALKKQVELFKAVLAMEIVLV